MDDRKKTKKELLKKVSKAEEILDSTEKDIKHLQKQLYSVEDYLLDIRECLKDL